RAVRLRRTRGRVSQLLGGYADCPQRRAARPPARLEDTLILGLARFGPPHLCTERTSTNLLRTHRPPGVSASPQRAEDRHPAAGVIDARLGARLTFACWEVPAMVAVRGPGTVHASGRASIPRRAEVRAMAGPGPRRRMARRPATPWSPRHEPWQQP